MAIIYTNEGEPVLLGWAIRDTGGDTKVKLFKNNFTPTATSVAADFTEADFTGYAAVDLERADWDAAASVSSAGAISPTANPTFTNSGSAQTVYGWYCTTSDDVTVLFHEKFASSESVTVSLALDITLTAASAT